MLFRILHPNRWFWWALAAVIAAGIALYGYSLVIREQIGNPYPVIVPGRKSPGPSPTPSYSIDISDWKTYRNEKRGFEIKYPPNWFVGERWSTVYISNVEQALNDHLPLTVAVLHIDFGCVDQSENIAWKTDNSQSWYGSGSRVVEGKHCKRNVYFTVSLAEDSPEKDVHMKLLEKIVSSLELTNDVYLLEEFAAWDERLVYYDPSGNRHIVIPSIKHVIPELKEPFNLILMEISFPKNTGKLFFASVLGSTEDCPGTLYSFTIQLKKFSKMRTTPYFYSCSFYLSPDGLKVASITLNKSSEQRTFNTLYIIDLQKDEVRMPVKLHGKESLTKELLYYGKTYYGDITWIDNNTLEYGVYDKTSGKDEGAIMEYQLIEKRRITID